MKKNSKGKITKTVGNIVGIMFLICVYAGLIISYGPFPWFKETLITTAMTTMEHKWLAEIVYSDAEIAKVLENSSVIEPEEDTVAAYVKIKEVVAQDSYASKEEEQVLKKDVGNEDYKIIPVEDYINPAHYYKGYITVIYDPSKVKIVVSKRLGNYGEYIDEIAKRTKAKIAINASGFEDVNLMGNGGSPTGTVIAGGKIIWGSDVGKVNIIGFNKDNILTLTRQTPQEAVASGVRDAVSFSPFLIVNGKAAFIKGNGGWGIAPRTAIGQRKDGIVLMLTIDGRQKHSTGADMVDLTEIMLKYGAYNAANVDGGSSTSLVENGTVITKPSAEGRDGMRAIPNAWVVY